jgi:hypothetical protein
MSLGLTATVYDGQKKGPNLSREVQHIRELGQAIEAGYITYVSRVLGDKITEPQEEGALSTQETAILAAARAMVHWDSRNENRI